MYNLGSFSMSFRLKQNNSTVGLIHPGIKEPQSDVWLKLTSVQSKFFTYILQPHGDLILFFFKEHVFLKLRRELPLPPLRFP